MSHFTVLVIGDNPEEQLAPYDENLEVAEYVYEVVAEEDLLDFMNFYTTIEPEKDYKKLKVKTIIANRKLSLDELYVVYGDDWNGNVWRKDGNTWKEYSTRNPNAKWDWYLLGGRWRGFFKAKDVNGKIILRGVLGEAGAGNNKPKYDYDQTAKCCINFERMKEDARKEAAMRYDKAMGCFGHLPRNRSWDSIRSEYKDIRKAREIYHNQLRIKALNDKQRNDDDFYSYDADEFLISKDQYVENARRDYMVTFAVVKNGEWHERGKMGWWGIVSDEANKNEWADKLNELIDSLPGDTLLSVYDCHI